MKKATLSLGRLSNKALSIFSEGDHGGSSAGSLGVFNDASVFSFHDGDTWVGGSKIDTNDFSFYLLAFFTKSWHLISKEGLKKKK